MTFSENFISCLKGFTKVQLLIIRTKQSSTELALSEALPLTVSYWLSSVHAGCRTLSSIFFIWLHKSQMAKNQYKIHGIILILKCILTPEFVLTLSVCSFGALRWKKAYENPRVKALVLGYCYVILPHNDLIVQQRQQKPTKSLNKSHSCSVRTIRTSHLGKKFQNFMELCNDGTEHLW